VATDTEKNIAANIKTRMAIRGLTVKEVAALIEIPVSTVYAVTKAEMGISFDRLELFAKALKCSVADLVASPIALDRPDVSTAWRVLRDFMDRLSPLKVELVEALASLDDSQVRRYLRMITAETSSASSADDVRPSTQALREPGKRAK
jgi:transcriptional regulator with XRE-family HTH domain